MNRPRRISRVPTPVFQKTKQRIQWEEKTLHRAGYEPDVVEAGVADRVLKKGVKKCLNKREDNLQRE